MSEKKECRIIMINNYAAPVTELSFVAGLAVHWSYKNFLELRKRINECSEHKDELLNEILNFRKYARLSLELCNEIEQQL